MGGSGSFDAILGGVGLSTAVSAYLTLIPDYLQGILWTTGWVPFGEYQALTSEGALLAIVRAYTLTYVVAHLLLYSITIGCTQGLGAVESSTVASIAFLGSFSVWITLVR